MQEQKEEAKQIYKCPNCNKRIFDAARGGEATITIKCPKCKEVVDVSVIAARSAESLKDVCI